LPRFRLVIAGSGELEQLLKALARELHLGEHVVFAGHVADLAPLYRAADLFVMSSHLEGLCTSILDAMATGIPVAATRAGGIPEIVRDGETGLLSSVRDPHALAQNILTLLQDHTLADTMVRIAHSMIQAQFTADAMDEGTIAAYGKILAAHGTSVAGDHPLRK
jgi:glycosyltransferase involved in cell wall biosynthesis